MPGAGDYSTFPPSVREHFTLICDTHGHDHPRTLDGMIRCALAFLAAEGYGETGSA